MSLPTYFYRIASARYCHDLSGKGAEMLGGRFNPVGTPAVYAASSISLATLELLVHASQLYPLAHRVMVLEVPEACRAAIQSVPAGELPYGWNSLGDTHAAQSFAMHALFGANQLGMLVPSVVTPEEQNLVLNPAHREMQRLTLRELRPLDLDARLIKRENGPHLSSLSEATMDTLYHINTLPPADKIDAIRRGLPASEAERIRDGLGLSQKAMFGILGTNDRTGLRLLKENRTLDPAASERLLRVVEVEQHAEAALGSRQLATQWMTTHNRVLGAVPVELLDTEIGHQQVRRVLMAIEYGGVV
ncbi:RES domain-containing protein [Burkholderiaceae bacterium DAT-1]|nr:RES domain-containing protein [Burkholderiaceae bacterium DAT-1]